MTAKGSRCGTTVRETVGRPGSSAGCRRHWNRRTPDIRIQCDGDSRKSTIRAASTRSLVIIRPRACAIGGQASTRCRFALCVSCDLCKSKITRLGRRRQRVGSSGSSVHWWSSLSWNAPSVTFCGRAALMSDMIERSVCKPPVLIVAGRKPMPVQVAPESLVLQMHAVVTGVSELTGHAPLAHLPPRVTVGVDSVGAVGKGQTRMCRILKVPCATQKIMSLTPSPGDPGSTAIVLV